MCGSETEIDGNSRAAEPVRGVFFPNVIEHKPTRNGQLDAVIRTTLSNVKINQDIPAATRHGVKFYTGSFQTRCGWTVASEPIPRKGSGARHSPVFTILRHLRTHS